jgi:3-oxoadipate CoA-transferase, alpha subunit
MAINKIIESASATLAEVRDQATVLISGFGGSGFPNVLISALRDAKPRGLTLVVNSATHPLSVTHELIEAGMVDKVIASAGRGRERNKLSIFEELLRDGKIEFECVPQGTMTERIRAGGAGLPAFYCPVGVGTDLCAGKEVRVFDGVECVLEHAIKGDLALIRADSADRYGNLNFSYAQANFGPAMATAAALTIAEVRTTSTEALAPTAIGLSGVFVDHVLAVGD